MYLSKKDTSYLYNFFGDNEVFFKSKERMIDSFEILHYISSEGIVFWKLKPNAKFTDVMGWLKDCDSKKDGVDVFCTHDDDGEEIEILENWCNIPESLMNNIIKDSSTIRKKIEEYVNK